MSEPNKPVSMSKNTGSAALAPRPPAALYAVYAIAGAAVMGVIASISLYTQKTWLNSSILKNLRDKNPAVGKKNHKTDAQLIDEAHKQVATTQKGAVIGAIVILLALGFIAYGVWKGRHWSRWGTLIIWFLSSFTGTVVGIGSVLGVGGDIPAAYKIPAFLAGALMIVGVALTNLPSAVRWFALSKPQPAPGQPARRGLFAPRPPAGGAAQSRATVRADTTRSTTPAEARATADRSRTKKRAGAASVAKGADLARTRAKAASKSRRTEA